MHRVSTRTNIINKCPPHQPLQRWYKSSPPWQYASVRRVLLQLTRCWCYWIIVRFIGASSAIYDALTASVCLVTRRTLFYGRQLFNLAQISAEQADSIWYRLDNKRLRIKKTSSDAIDGPGISDWGIASLEIEHSLSTTQNSAHHVTSHLQLFSDDFTIYSCDVVREHANGPLGLICTP